MSIRRTGVVLASVLVVASCASVPTAPGASGFLSDYAGLQADGPHVMVRNAERGALESISGFCIAEPEIRADHLTDKDRAQMRAALTKALSASFGELRPIRGGPGADDCAEVRTAVTGLVKSNVVENVVFGIAVLPVIPSNGAVAIEGEVTERAGRVSAIVWAKTGSALSLISGLQSTGQARALTRDFAKRFAATLGPG
jgi:hypothetical protein